MINFPHQTWFEFRGTVTANTKSEWNRPGKCFCIGSGLVFASIVSASCTVAPIRAYEGETLPREQTSLLRAIGPGRIEIDAPGYMLLEVELDNPLSGEPVESRFVSSLDSSPWMAISTGYQCFVVRSRPMRCPSFLEEVVGIGSQEVQCQSLSANAWTEQEVCFEAGGQAEYEIRVDASWPDDCSGDLVVAGIRVIERKTDELIEEYADIGDCSPFGSTFSP